MTATLIDGKAIAARMRDETRAEAGRLTDLGWAPKLVSISVGDVARISLKTASNDSSFVSLNVTERETS